MQILVTGGGGFIGRNITRRLVREGHEVIITASGTDHIEPGVSKVLYMTLTGIDWDQIKFGPTKEQFNIDLVIHQMANNDTRCQDTHEMYKANCSDAVDLFKRAMNRGCRRFVYASSTAVYGHSPAPYIEGVTPIAPVNVYGKSKASFDSIAEELAKQDKERNQFDYSIIGLRYCNVYGPGEENKGRRMSMIGQMIKKMAYLYEEYSTEIAVRLFRDGEQKRDWVYIDDVVEANMLAVKKTETPGHFGIYNIGSGVASSFNEIVNTLNSLIEGNGWKLVPEYMDCPFPDEFQTHTECNVEKARGELGFSPRYDLRTGIQKYLELNQF